MPRCFFVAGRPIAHSFSPELFKAFASDGNYDMYYTRAVCRDEQDIVMLLEHGFHGCNITSPFKETSLELPFPKTQTVETIRAANLIFMQNGTFVFHNTDVDAVEAILGSLHILPGSHILVLGAGGAGRAATFAALQRGFHVTIANRTDEKSARWGQLLGCSVLSWNHLKDGLYDVDVIINTQPDITILKQFVAAGKIIIDAIYHHSLKNNEFFVPCNRYIDGLQWLAWQAVTGFTFLTGKYVEADIMLDVVHRGLQTKKQSLPMVLIGMMKSGKTTTGRLLSEKLQIDFIDLDDRIEKHAGKSIEAIFLEEGEARFREIESAVFAELINRSSRAVIAAGGGLVVSEQNRKLLRNNCFVIWLFAPPAELLQRQDNVPRPLLQGNIQEQFHQIYQQRLSYYCQCADILVPSFNATPHEVTHLIVDELLHINHCVIE